MADGQVLTPSSPSTLDTTTQLSTNRNLGQLVDILSSSSGDSTAILNDIASAITSSIVGGTTGTNANRLLRAKGTGGFALQPGVVAEDDSGNLSGVASLSIALTPNSVVASGASNPSALTVISNGTSGQFLRSTGPSSLPTFQTFTVTMVDGIAGFVPFPANQAYRIWVNSPFAFTITSTTTQCTSGTCTLTFNVNGTGVGGSANAVSTTQQTQAHSASVAAGQYVEMTVSANSSCTNMSFQIAISRVLF